MRKTDTAMLSATATITTSWWKKPSFRKKLVPWLFMLPILLLHFIVIVGPATSSLYYSLTEWSGMGAAKFVGLENYRHLLFENTSFKAALLHNVIWLAFFLTVPFFMALLGASQLAPIRRGGMFFRTALFVPYVLPGIIAANLGRYFLSPRLGIGAQLAKIGIKGLDIAYLGNPKTALLSVAFIDNWHYWGFLMVLFLTAMQSIPKELYEAARIDGASRRQEFLHITLPGIRPTVVFMFLMMAIWSVLVFEYVWILTQGGPAGATEVLGTMVYKQAFTRFNAGYAAAIGLSMSFLAAIFLSIYGILKRRGWDI